MSTDLAVRAPSRSSASRERRLVVLACAAVYLAVAIWFWWNQLLPGDAMSRVANGYYVLYSRDPHLAAIGFVWNPLPSLILLPFLPLAKIFPALTQQGLLAVLASALLMTATVAVAHDVLRRIGVRRVPRLVLTAAFALHPMTLLYAGNGMSEACFLLCLMLAVRYFHMWLAEGRTELLVPLGLALAVGYGARYEALAPAAAVTVVVGLTTFLRTAADHARRWSLARADAVIVGMPPILAFLLWAAASKIIVDQWFATFSSVYGNSTQVSTNATYITSMTGDDLPGRAAYWSQQLIGLSPLALALVAIALLLAWRRRDFRILAPVTVLGAVLAFDALAFLSGTSFGWLRFNITVIPLAVLTAGHLIAWAAPAALSAPATPAALTAPATPAALTAPAALSTSATPASPTGSATRSAALTLPGWVRRRSLPADAPDQPPTRGHAPSGGGAPSSGGVARRALVVVAYLAAFIAIPSTIVVLSKPDLSREESEWVTASGAERRRNLAQVDAQVATDLDTMNLPDGAVLTDAAYAFGVVLASDRPRQFVITPDRDFPAALGDPAGHHVQYLLLSAEGSADAVRTARYGPDKSAVPTTGVRTWHDAKGGLQWTLIPVP
ncbi:hypothetical protein [Actinoplanes sp. L3-i22]|uniref:hypothetical protein n=1 Tax=Actinoplanes sp. L3-i22 TaxID=2836373 RepID=UPI001C7792D6|nr:hypothetical protein [Actinoplanes sp. L3-i22]BCY06878.1 hypothetical protein L3i22_019660 [Actinoplanes sp. L3-i22]